MSDKHVAVLMGGWSAERQVSLDSGNPCADALENEGFKVTRIDVDRNVAAVLEDLKPDVAFNALHGRFGEDGCIQGILEYLKIPYTHSGVMASALAMDKHRAKIVMQEAGIPVAPGKVVSRQEAAKGHVMDRPYVLKPVNEGSSVGVFIVQEDHEHPPQELNSAEWTYAEMLLAEKYIPGRELTCAVFNDEVFDVIDIISTDHFYDYRSKYAPGGSKHILPAEISPNIYQFIQKLTVRAHKALGCRGISRADFRFDEKPDGTGELICLEVNTQPGMTETSLVPELAVHAGYTFGSFLRLMVEDASCER